MTLESKVPILKEVTSEKCNSVELNTFSTYLSSLLGVIAIVFNPRMEVPLNSTEVVHFSEVNSFKIGTLVKPQADWRTVNSPKK